MQVACYFFREKADSATADVWAFQKADNEDDGQVYYKSCRFSLFTGQDIDKVYKEFAHIIDKIYEVDNEFYIIEERISDFYDMSVLT